MILAFWHSFETIFSWHDARFAPPASRLSSMSAISGLLGRQNVSYSPLNLPCVESYLNMYTM